MSKVKKKGSFHTLQVIMNHGERIAGGVAVFNVLTTILRRLRPLALFTRSHLLHSTRPFIACQLYRGCKIGFFYFSGQLKFWTLQIFATSAAEYCRGASTDIGCEHHNTPLFPIQWQNHSCLFSLCMATPFSSQCFTTGRKV